MAGGRDNLSLIRGQPIANLNHPTFNKLMMGKACPTFFFLMQKANFILTLKEEKNKLECDFFKKKGKKDRRTLQERTDLKAQKRPDSKTDPDLLFQLHSSCPAD